MNWKNVFDGDKLISKKIGSLSIYDVNQFLYENTEYGYFSFNGTVFSVHFPSQFTEEEVTRGYKVGAKVSELE